MTHHQIRKTGIKISLPLLFLGSLALTIPYWLDVLADPDLWWHTLTGKIILEGGKIPSQDLFSFTAVGNSWINHEWLTDITFAITWDLAGDEGLLFLRILIFILFVFFWAIALWRRWKNEFAVLIVIAFSLPIMNLFMNVRPQSFTFLFIVIFLCIWDSWREGRRIWMFFTPILMLLWVNMHGGFLFGIVLNLIYLFVTCIGEDNAAAKDQFRQKRILLIIIICSLAATLINPWGIKLYSYIYEELRSDHLYISEWQKVDPQQQIFFAAYAIIPIGLYLLSKKFGKPAIPILFLLSAYSAWNHVRFMMLLVMFGGLLAMQAAGDLYHRTRSSRIKAFWQRITMPANVMIFIVMVALYGGYQTLAIATNKESVLSLDAPKSLMPMDAICFLESERLGPNLALFFDWNGCVIWHLFPKYKVAVDGRNTTVYKDDWVDVYVEHYEDGQLMQLLSNTVDVYLIKRKDPMDIVLAESSLWDSVYQDGQAVVYVKTDHREMIEGDRVPDGSDMVEPFPGSCMVWENNSLKEH